jgi:signal transduction histidine kinase
MIDGKKTPTDITSRDDLRTQFDDFSKEIVLSRILDAMPSICMIVTRDRQIIYANKAMVDAVGAADSFALCGLRPGEALRCIHSSEAADGCGGAEACTTCGSLDAVLAGNTEQSPREFRITRIGEEVMDARIWAAPIEVRGEAYTLLTIVDVGDEKRRRVLERLFFHDILNTAGAIRSFCELLTRRPEELDKTKERIVRLSKRLIEEIDTQKQLTDAENRDLVVNIGQVSTKDLLEQVLEQSSEPGNPGGPAARLSDDLEKITFSTDPVILRRVLANLLKNAIEASLESQEVVIGARRIAETVQFTIHNQGSMPRNVQLQVFQRSFSTKGIGRGLGTYSARLLTETYLKGTVTFESTAEKGTVFKASYPMVLK